MNETLQPFNARSSRTQWGISLLGSWVHRIYRGQSWLRLRGHSLGSGWHFFWPLGVECWAL